MLFIKILLIIILINNDIYIFDNIPELRIGIISHGDYCDGSRAINKIDFTKDLNSLTGLIGGYNTRYPYTPYLFKTTNGGLNWSLRNFDNSNSTIWSLFFINENTGFVCGLESGNSIRGKISKTTKYTKVYTKYTKDHFFE